MSLPGHGETVGTAYIRILADGSGLRSDIEREWARHRGEMEEMGKEDGAQYEDARAKEQQRLFKRHLQDEVKQNRQASAQRNAIFRNSLKQQIDDYRKMANQQRKIDNDTMLRSLANQARQLRQQEKDFNEFDKLVQRRYDSLSKMSTRFAAHDRDTVRKQFADLRRAINLGDPTGEAIQGFRKLRAETDRMIHDADHGFLIFDRRLKSGFRSSSDLERSIGRVDQRIRGLDLGKVFGKGSRNDFFNALGSVVGSLSEFVILAGFKAVGALEKFRRGLSQAHKEGRTFSFLFDTLGSSIAKLITGAGGLFLGLNAIQLVAGPLAAAISLLAGGITALASSIVIGLVGAVGAALPVLGVFGVGIGVLTVALGHLDAAQKKLLSTRLKPVIDDFKQLRNETRKALFSGLKEQVPLVDRLLNRDIGPLFVSAAKSISKSWTASLKVLDGKEMTKNFAAFRTFIPDAISKLGKIFTNVFTGISGVLRALVPIAQRFLDSLVDGTARFTKFANSTLGQNKISVWFTNAYDSGRRLWRTVRDLIKILFDLFNAGQLTGDTLFDRLNSKLEEFDRFLRSDRGRTALTKWFQDSANMLSHLGKALGAIFGLFKTLAGGGSGALNTILDVLGQIAEIIKENLPIIQQFQREFFTELGRVADALFKAIKPLRPVISDLLRIFGGALASTARIFADILVPVLNGIANITEFIARHENVFRPMIEALALFWAAWKGYTILTSVATAIRIFFATTVATTRTGIANVLFALRTGTGQALTAREKFGAALSGLAIAGGAIGLGNSMGGTGGLLTNILGGAAGGGLAGSVFGPVGTGLGVALGAVTGAITHFWSAANKSAEESKKKHEAVIESIAAAAQRLRGTLTQDQNAIRSLSREQIAMDLQQKSPGLSKSALQAAQDAQTAAFGGPQLKLGKDIIPVITTTDVVKAASGNVKALNTITTAAAQVHARLRQLALEHPTFSEKQFEALPDVKRLQAIQSNLGIVTKSLQREISAVKASVRENDQLKESLGKLNLATRDVNTEVLAYGKSLKDNTLAGDRNKKFIQDHIVAMTKSAGVNLKAGKSVGDVTTSLLANVNAFRSQLTQAGFNQTKVLQLIGTYGKIPKSVLTKLLADPSDVDKNTARALGRLGLLPKNVLTKILGKDEASAIINRVNDRLRRLPSIHISVLRVRKDPSFDAIILSAQNAINGLSGTTNVIVGRRSISGPSIQAAGSIINGAKHILAGEAGREAIVPLERPLSQVDPSVRALSAFAQGLPFDSEPKMARGGVVGGGRTLNVEAGAITVVTPTTDPVAVAEETLARLVAKGY